VATMRVVPSPYSARSPAGYVQLIMGVYRQFAPEQIAHFKWNVVGGMIGSDFYGMGIVQCILEYWDALRTMEVEYMPKIMRRYAAPKIHWRLGSDLYPAKPEDIASWSSSLRRIEPDEDYVSSHLAQASFIGPDVRARFEEYIEHFRLNIIAGLQNPVLILSMTEARVSDASANAMLKALNRKVHRLQKHTADLVEDLIFKPLVRQEGLSEVPRLVFEELEEGPEERFQKLTGLLDAARVGVTPETRREVENMLRRELGLEPLPKTEEPQVIVAPPLPGGDED